MLQSLHVKNLALIDEAEVEFQDGLNILTGETGAGKSILLGSVQLALGGKYTADLLREGAQYGLVELEFYISSPGIVEKLKQMDIEPEEGMVVLSRKLMDQRSVSRINGEMVPISRLKAAAEVLIDIHGQHEHQSLLYKKKHMEILDAYARKETAGLKEKVREAYRRTREAKQELDEALSHEADRKKEADFLTFEVEEIREANPVPGEDEELEEQYRKMKNGKKITESLVEAYGFTGGYEGGSASELFSRAIHALSEAAEYDGHVKELYGQLVEIDSLLNDFNRELSSCQDELQFSEEEFYETETRLNTLNHLKAKYGKTMEEVLAYASEKEKRLLILADYDAYLDSLKKTLKEEETILKKEAEKLTAVRKKYAVSLAKELREGIRDLNFLDVDFEVEVRPLPEFTENGADEIEFMISLNPGEKKKPLGAVASGGELSRIMLAVKAALADKDEVETLIFDEIDTGISGRTAQKVSEKMALLGKRHQVLCITHLAQIAAMADAHYLIRKDVEDGKTKTQIRKLEEKETVSELARILGGAEITDAVYETAKEMKKLACEIKTRE